MAVDKAMIRAWPLWVVVALGRSSRMPSDDCNTEVVEQSLVGTGIAEELRQQLAVRLIINSTPRAWILVGSCV